MTSVPVAREMNAQLQPDGTLVVRLAGNWRTADGLPAPGDVHALLATAGQAKGIVFDTSGLGAWDSGLLTVMLKISNHARERTLQLGLDGLPEGVRRLLHLALAVPEKKDAARGRKQAGLLERVGRATLRTTESALEMLEFLGSATIALLRFVRGKAQYRRSDLFLTIQQCGAEALPIVSLISVLIGLILAFVGGVQLKAFGAQIYVADLVGVAMTREMGAIMTGVILAGRTGAAFAAQLGTMTVNEEIDALKTFGIAPMDYLVLPRMLALALMMPLLCLYADLVGIVGGAIVGISMPNVSLTQYLDRTVVSVGLDDVVIGVFKGAVFGILIAVSGCMMGMKCGRSSAAVGNAATSAVVAAIVLIIVTDAIFAVLTNILGI